MTTASKNHRNYAACLLGAILAAVALIALCWAGVALGGLASNSVVEVAGGLIHSRNISYAALFLVTAFGIGISFLLALIATGLAMTQQD